MKMRILKKNTYLGPKRCVWRRLGPHWYPFGLRWLSLAVVGLRLAFVGLWGSKWVVWMMRVSKCIDGVLRRVAGSRNTWLRVSGCTIRKTNKKNHKKETPMAQITPDVSFGLVVVVATPRPPCAFIKT